MNGVSLLVGLGPGCYGRASRQKLTFCQNLSASPTASFLVLCRPDSVLGLLVFPVCLTSTDITSNSFRLLYAVWTLR